MLIAAWCEIASASLIFDYSGSPVAITDNDASGVAFGFTLSDPAASITALTVTLNISGGYNGDLYAYLSHGSGFAVLLNRTGVGASTSGSSANGYANTGFAITFDAAASANIHFYQNNSPGFNGSGQLTGTWQPDGRGVDPESAASAFDASGTANFSTFTGLNPNGTWTLFIADVSAGSISTLNDFTVSVSAAVPEPVNVALGIFGGLWVVCSSVRNQRVRRVFFRVAGLTER
jgi:subtilisin-like proprotein convertase family protein